MLRKDRLAILTRALRRPGPHRAEDLARETGVSPRTIWRDLDTLRAAGVPVEGTRGTGYHITAEVTLPPLNLSLAELEALHLGLIAVGRSGDAALAAAAESLADRLDAALSEEAPAELHAPALRFPDPAGTGHLATLRQAVRARQKLRVVLGGDAQVVRPLRLDYWGRVWTLVVWSETAEAFADLPVARIEAVTPLPALFSREPGRELADR